jgi:hypothetical protein
MLLLDDYQELVKLGITPEQEILTRHFTYFGPVHDGLFKQVNDEDWVKALKGASEMSELAVEDQPQMRFKRWGVELGDQAVDMISGMTNPDPTARLTINQVLAHPWWQEDT